MDKEDKLPGENVPLLKELDAIKSTVKGILAALTKVNATVVSSSCVQLLKGSIPDLELNTIRMGFSLVFFIIGLIWKKEWPLVPRSEILGLAMYSLAIFGTSASFYIAVTVIPVATAECLSITTTILAGMVLHRLIMAEKITLVLVSSGILCIVGVAMIIQPEFIFSRNGPVAFINNTSESKTYNLTVEHTEESSSFLSMIGSYWKYATPSIDGLCIVAQIIVIKKKPFLQTHVLIVLFWGMLSSSILSAILMSVFETLVLPKDWYSLLLTVIHSCSIVIIYPTSIIAVKHISGNTFNIVCSAGVISMLVAQYTVLASILPGHKNWIEIVGVMLVLIGSTLGSIIEVLKSIKNTKTNI